MFADNHNISWLLTRKRISTTFLKHKSRAFPRLVLSMGSHAPQGNSAVVKPPQLESGTYGWSSRWVSVERVRQLEMDEGRSAMQFHFNGNPNLII